MILALAINSLSEVKPQLGTGFFFKGTYSLPVFFYLDDPLPPKSDWPAAYE